MIYLESYSSPLGELTMASDGEYLTGLWFDGQKYDRAGIDPSGRTVRKTLPVFTQTGQWLDLYFEGKDPGRIPPVRLRGSAFREVVWQILTEIPYGTTTTYKRIADEAARRMGKARMSAQAAGGAVGHNPVGIIVPCHRVIGTDGSLTGYAGGLERKKWLLELEKVNVKQA